jgi:hypothetical protein
MDSSGGGWVNDGPPTGDVETINKIRDGIDPGSGQSRLYAYYERPGGGQTWMISREFATGWEFESVPSVPASVGGRGLGVDPANLSTVYGGSSNAPGDDVAQVSQKSGGSWGVHRTVDNALMWELEFDADGRLWEFYNNFGKESLVSKVFVGGEDKGPSHGGDISCAAWFDGFMYTTGALSLEHSQDVRTAIARSADGSSWEVVHTFETAHTGDHVFVIPRDPPELWAVGHEPLEVLYSPDGTTWTRELTIPEFATGIDTNHLTAIAFWKEGVWIFARDESRGTTRAFTDGGPTQDLILQVI